MKVLISITAIIYSMWVLALYKICQDPDLDYEDDNKGPSGLLEEDI